jgi:hypothetical protein
MGRLRLDHCLYVGRKIDNCFGLYAFGLFYYGYFNREDDLMAGGPIFPNSAFPVTNGFVFPNFHVGAGANSKQDEGLGVTDATTLTSHRYRLEQASYVSCHWLMLRLVLSVSTQNGPV